MDGDGDPKQKNEWKKTSQEGEQVTREEEQQLLKKVDESQDYDSKK